MEVVVVEVVEAVDEEHEVERRATHNKEDPVQGKYKIKKPIKISIDSKTNKK